MKCGADILNLAEEKLKDAQCLMTNKKFDACYYFAGYVIELLLKAKVCKTLSIDNFFADNSPAKKLRGGESTYKVHNFEQLIILSGLYSKLIIELNDPTFKKHWSFISEWNESSRYLTGKAETDAQNFLTSVTKIKQWIEKHL